MLHYFNPGHETAVLNGSPYYTPPAIQQRMLRDLASLPAWYGAATDFVLIENLPTEEFIQSISNLNAPAKGITIDDIISKKQSLVGTEVALWGISPSSIHLFENINSEYDSGLLIPQWKSTYKQLCSRRTAKECLEYLIGFIPEISNDIVPRFYHALEEIDLSTESYSSWLAKAPYSSSGRGLLWLTNKGLIQTEKQILSGILKKQGSVSIEKGLDKQLDFAMQFFSDGSGNIEYKGLSLFETTEKGTYKGNVVSSQEYMVSSILSFVDSLLLEKAKQHLTNFLSEKFASDYRGFIGVDMMVYVENDSFRLHPCVEINMRTNMGILALQLYQNYVYPDAKGFFQISFDAHAGATFQKHKMMMNQYPLQCIDNRISSGYLSLCPVREDSHYLASVLINSNTGKYPVVPKPGQNRRLF